MVEFAGQAELDAAAGLFTEKSAMKKSVCVAFLAGILLLLASCSGTDGISGATENRYQKLEIREYKGTKLDPSIGPRDNSIKGIQNVDISTYRLKVSGLVRSPVSLTYSEVLALTPYEKLITLHCVEGWDATVLWKGVLLKDIIEKSSAEGNAVTVIFHSVDGYTTSLPLQYVLDRNIILAYSSNGITLPPQLGYPFIVVAEDKLGYKWARWVNEIELSDDPNYKGYWETKGFSNDANIE
jgi:DMSO/TMAO reductase YedYZ molybdopterin-dependent catalytic subunit